MSDDFLASNWIHAKEMFIGLQSALVGVFMLRKPTAWTILRCLVMSVFSASAFGPAIAGLIRFSNSPYYEATIAAAGLTGGAICYGIDRLVKKWFALFEEKME